METRVQGDIPLLKITSRKMHKRPGHNFLSFAMFEMYVCGWWLIFFI